MIFNRGAIDYEMSGRWVNDISSAPLSRTHAIFV